MSKRIAISVLLTLLSAICFGEYGFAQTSIDMSGIRNENKTKKEDKVLALLPGKVQSNYGYKAEAAVFAAGTYAALASTLVCGAFWAYNDRMFNNSSWDRSHYADNASSFSTATVISAGALLGFYVANYIDAMVVSRRENRRPVTLAPSLPSGGGAGFSMVLRF